MEQNNNMDGGEHVHHVTQEPTRKESWDERVIRQGIEEALHEDRNIDDRTARYIASQLHGGQDSALYSLASTGNIPPDIHDELTRDLINKTMKSRTGSTGSVRIAWVGLTKGRYLDGLSKQLNKTEPTRNTSGWITFSGRRQTKILALLTSLAGLG
jgi:hypothetical protein